MHKFNKIIEESEKLSRDERLQIGLALATGALAESGSSMVVAVSPAGKSLLAIGTELVDKLSNVDGVAKGVTSIFGKDGILC